ncbi:MULTISPECIES: CHY zinc finger protein [Paraliobacillus]|uniref:CHY zinc finger protein n=1 Tax=Paraliobacillus TaxID=200903 RepID=UPI000DD40F64|nr:MULTISPECIES: CHY zinc finger protein [Paraliobacillus]
MIIHGHHVEGNVIDSQTRCSHYHQIEDVIAIKFKCCQTYYPCYKCHQEKADHHAILWTEEEFDTEAILCGVCGKTISIETYLGGNSTCPQCEVAFNPGCKIHRHLYFE